MPTMAKTPNPAEQRPSSSGSNSNAQQQGQQSTSGTQGQNNQNQNAANQESTPGKKDNKPSDSRFKQQKLKAWQPILTAGTVLPTFFVIGLIFIPIGAVLLVTSNQVEEHVFDYTDDCESTLKREDDPEKFYQCKDVVKNQTLLKDAGYTCYCHINVVLPRDIKKDVYIYYGLTNFYQNHRRYVKSRCDVQLLGFPKETSSDCEPFQELNKLAVVPCGAVANSWFNDTFTLNYNQVRDGTSNAPSAQVVDLLYTGIAWPSDVNKKFGNPAGGWNSYKNDTTKPPSWNKYIWEIDGGMKNESFIVWMRTAALPTFRKLHSRVNHSIHTFRDGLPAGNYSVLVQYNYPVDAFDGKKRFIISNTSWAGGRNPFLGVAYIVVGSLCILTGFIFLLIHMKFGKSLTELASVN